MFSSSRLQYINITGHYADIVKPVKGNSAHFHEHTEEVKGEVVAKVWATSLQLVSFTP